MYPSSFFPLFLLFDITFLVKVKFIEIIEMQAGRDVERSPVPSSAHSMLWVTPGPPSQVPTVTSSGKCRCCQYFRFQEITLKYISCYKPAASSEAKRTPSFPWWQKSCFVCTSPDWFFCPFHKMGINHTFLQFCFHFLYPPFLHWSSGMNFLFRKQINPSIFFFLRWTITAPEQPAFLTSFDFQSLPCYLLCQFPE